MPDKPFEQWEFNDLKSWATWTVIEGITSGKALIGIMHSVLDVAIRWRVERDKYERQKRKR